RRRDRGYDAAFVTGIIPEGQTRQRFGGVQPTESRVHHLDRIWWRVEGDVGVALDPILPDVAEQKPVVEYLDRLHLAERETFVGEVAANFEHIAEVRAKGVTDGERNSVLVVVLETQALVQAALVQEAIAANADGARLGDDLSC